MRPGKLALSFRGVLFHVAGSVLVFAVWRITGMPSPGTLGRLIPLAWITLGIASGRIGIPRFSVVFLALFTILALLWRVHPSIHVLSAACAVLGLFPGIMATASGGSWWSLVRAALPLFFLTVLLVPFEGDEPHYAAITERLTGSSRSVFTDPGVQMGDLDEGTTHHSMGFPLLLVPGYPAGQGGVRTVSFILAIASVLLMAHLYRRYGMSPDGGPAWMALLLLPGAGILGLLYPGWVCIGLFCFGVPYATRGSRWGILILALVSVLMTVIKFRFFFLGAGLVVVWFIRLSLPRKWRYAIMVAAAGILLLAADHFVLGGGLFWNRYGNIEMVTGVITNLTARPGSILLAMLASILDVEAGMLWKAPWIILALAGLPSLRRKHPDLFLGLGLPSLLYLVVLFVWMPSAWHGLPTPPGRLFMPLIPLLLASASMLMRKRSAWILLWFSLAITALCTADPVLRFNHADGTDAIVSLLTGGSQGIYNCLPSWVHPSTLPFLFWGAFTVLLVRLTLSSGRGVQWAFLAAAVFTGLTASGYPNSWEAENLGPEFRTGCALYPSDQDPGGRNYWLFERAPLLLLGHGSDAVSLPLPPGDGDIRISVWLKGMSSGQGSVPGMEITGGSGSVFVEYVDSPLREAPGWIIRRARRGEIPREPENLADTVLVCTLPGTERTLSIGAVWSDGYAAPPAGLYIDRIEVRRL